jgi:succinate dehydrogenase / fumarate reductase, cytochrome b subunit
MSKTDSKRPLSPHLTIYKPQISSMMSILHRATGCFLSIGLILAICFFSSLALGRDSYEDFISTFNGFFGTLLILPILGAYFYHLCNGVRHLFWDAGFGFPVEQVNQSGKIVFIVAAGATLLSWLAFIF